jgi:hypothetical protein
MIDYETNIASGLKNRRQKGRGPSVLSRTRLKRRDALTRRVTPIRLPFVDDHRYAKPGVGFHGSTRQTLSIVEGAGAAIIDACPQPKPIRQSLFGEFQEQSPNALSLTMGSDEQLIQTGILHVQRKKSHGLGLPAGDVGFPAIKLLTYPPLEKGLVIPLRDVQSG